MKHLFILLALVLGTYELAQSQVSDSLTINNINAVVTSTGIFFSHADGSPGFEVPKGSGKHLMNGSKLLVGGVDVNDNLKVAAEIGHTAGRDFFAGPLTEDGIAAVDFPTQALFNHVWKLRRSEIDEMRADYAQGNLVTQQSVFTQVAQKFVLVGMGSQALFSGFVDSNNDGLYSPTSGDYPNMKGDEAIFQIFNDKGNIHTQTGAASIGLEIHALAYAFDCNIDSALMNTIFLDLTIINQSTYTLTGTYMDIMADINIGNRFDDYMACDAGRACFIGYNSTANDVEYGDNPPALAVAILNGPFQDADGIDNRYGVGPQESVNGLGFGSPFDTLGDGIIDNERFGMSRFMTFNDGSDFNGLPHNGSDFYHYMHGIWKDGQEMTFGSDGHDSTSIPSRLQFTGGSDSLNFATYGTSPTTSNWTENSTSTIPNNRFGMAGSDAFTLQPGSISTISVAYVYAQGQSGNVISNVELVKARVDAIRAMHSRDSIPCGGGFAYQHVGPTGIKESKPTEITLFPNPATDFIQIEGIKGGNEDIAFRMIDVIGKTVLEGKLNPSGIIGLNGVSKGLYFLNLSLEEGEKGFKVVVE